MMYKAVTYLGNGPDYAWITEPLQGGETYSLDQLHRSEDSKIEGDEWTEVPNTASGDYAGSTVGLANYEWLQENYGDHKDVAFVTGSYGYKAVIYRVSSEDEDLMETINALEDYPLVDDESLSMLEMSLADEAWESWGFSDFIRELTKLAETEADKEAQDYATRNTDSLIGADEWQKLYDTHYEAVYDRLETKVESLTSEQAYELFNVIGERANVNGGYPYRGETNNVYLYIDEVAKAVEWSDVIDALNNALR